MESSPQHFPLFDLKSYVYVFSCIRYLYILLLLFSTAISKPLFCTIHKHIFIGRFCGQIILSILLQYSNASLSVFLCYCLRVATVQCSRCTLLSIVSWPFLTFCLQSVFFVVKSLFSHCYCLYVYINKK